MLTGNESGNRAHEFARILKTRPEAEFPLETGVGEQRPYGNSLLPAPCSPLSPVLFIRHFNLRRERLLL